MKVWKYEKYLKWIQENWYFWSFQIFLHSVKSVQIRSFFWSVFSRSESECEKIRTRKISVLGHFSRSTFLTCSVKCENPANIYMFKVNNRNNRERCRCGSFIVNFEHISHLLLVLLLLTLNKCELRSSRQMVFCKKVVFKNVAKFTGQHLYESLINKVADLRLATLF